MKPGYCTNVHAGSDLEMTRANLQEHALAVKNEFSPGEPMGIGLWLSDKTATDLLQKKKVDEFGSWLREAGLVPYTFNGFPFGDFHQAVVKHDVYLPTWADSRRYDYTIRLIEILDSILDAGMEGSISTLPIGWPEPKPTEEFVAFAAEQLRRVARELAKLASETGRLIYICIEPEPGCFLETSDQVVRFFENSILRPSPADEACIRRHLRICHDVCHASVMFEPQKDVLQRYRKAGIDVGKVQISSAIRVPLADLDSKEKRDAIRQLGEFAEDRYLHQTTVLQENGTVRFYEDLTLAIKEIDPDSKKNVEMRIHFHVPIYLEEFGLLKTSRDEIVECCRLSAEIENLTHFEVETYAWDVLPDHLREPTLATGIAKELAWFSQL